MPDLMARISDPKLTDSLLKIRELMGSMVPSRELQEKIPGFKTQKGIYKPQNSEYALWIRQTLTGVYQDQEPAMLPDGSWYYRYSPEGKKGETDLSLSTNRALFKSMEDGVPIGVFIQREIAGSQSTYEVMGLAYVENFDDAYFIIHGEPIDNEAEPMTSTNIPQFKPFDVENLSISKAMSRIRKIAFQTGVRRVYHEKCSLCELGYRFNGQPIGVQAAHLIPVSDQGTSKDLRNGILLCNNHHALFDRYLWTFDEDFRVIVKDDPQFRHSAENNHVLTVEGKRLPNLPDAEYDFPASEAISFRLDRFNKTYQ
ncbi:MAG: HNH endonuclease [Candidatus Thermoplasmatota archaeon]|nr:HNH endonuclease [Candidatus Thermoplasmatota archaeon]